MCVCACVRASGCRSCKMRVSEEYNESVQGNMRVCRRYSCTPYLCGVTRGIQRECRCV